MVAAARSAKLCPAGPSAPLGPDVPGVCCELTLLRLLPTFNFSPALQLFAAPPARCTDRKL